MHNFLFSPILGLCARRPSRNSLTSAALNSPASRQSIPVAISERYQNWVAQGMAGEMRYSTDRRAEVRRDVRNLLPSAKSVICVGKLYNTPDPPRTSTDYAWGKDYHVTMRTALERMVARLLERESFSHKICVNTAPLLERSFARLAGLGWIRKNTCLINEPLGSWFLGEIITSLDLEPHRLTAAGRCGSCTRCIDACPTDALVPDGNGWTLDARRCISYLTIELRRTIPEELPCRHGRPRFRLRYLSADLPVELAGPDHRRSGLRGNCHSASRARAVNTGSLSPALQGLTHRARDILRPMRNSLCYGHRAWPESPAPARIQRRAHQQHVDLGPM